MKVWFVLTLEYWELEINNHNQTHCSNCYWDNLKTAVVMQTFNFSCQCLITTRFIKFIVFINISIQTKWCFHNWTFLFLVFQMIFQVDRIVIYGMFLNSISSNFNKVVFKNLVDCFFLFVFFCISGWCYSCVLIFAGLPLRKSLNLKFS